MDSVSESKRKRSTAKSQVTRKVNELRRLVAEDNREQVLIEYDAIKDTFHSFIEAHSLYHSSLTDEADIIVSDSYYETVENGYIDSLNDVRDYIKCGNGVTPEKESASVPKSMSVLKLPPVPQPDVFSGNAESYPMWKASFRTLVDKHDIGFDEKMYYLKQYTSGEARSAIEALFLCPNKTSYEAALLILQDRFGNSSMVSSAFRKKLESWPKIADRDGKALQKFSDYLTQIRIAKDNYKSLDILSDEFENKKLLSKLPASIVNEWIETVVDSENFPDFDKFAHFIAGKAKVANHSLWAGNDRSRLGMNMTPNASQRVRPQTCFTQSQTHVQPVQDPGPKHIGCIVCGNNHTVSKCSQFVNMSLNDRKQTVREKRMCFGCLGLGHQSRTCRVRHTCTVCNRKHPTLLHDYSITQQIHSSSNDMVGADTAQGTPASTHTAPIGRQQSSTTLLGTTQTLNRATTMVLPVKVKNKATGQNMIVYALLDTQSDTHFVTSEVADALNLSGQSTVLNLKTMNGSSKKVSNAIDDIQIESVLGDSKIDIGRCFTRDSIPCNRNSIPSIDTLKDWPHLSDIDLPPLFEDAPIGLLLGFHCSSVMRPLEVITAGEDEPFGWRTSMGWCVLGVVTSCEDLDEYGLSHSVQGCIALRTECRESLIEPDYVPYCDEMPGLDSKYSADDIRFMEIMSTQMKQKPDKHYEAPLPLKNDSKFPSNRSQAVKRLSNLKQKLSRDAGYFQLYVSAVQDMIDQGFAEIVPPDESPAIDRTWYIPHHGVMQGKLRVVFDCSATYQGVSLNDRLLQGPDLTNSLLGILLRFRLDKIALTCDIQKMYHQFSVDPKDRDLLRFLWWPNGDLSAEPVDHRMRVHLFGATSSPAVATYGLRKIATDYSCKYSPEAYQFIMQDFYVDDGVTVVSSVTSGSDLIKDTKKLLGEGGLKCHKFMSNSGEVLEGIPVEDRATVDSDLHKTLGVSWDIKHDKLCFSLSVDLDKVTRRSLLSCIQRFYDPLGVLSPLLLPAKVILQKMCLFNCQWDDPISDQLLKSVEDWREVMNLTSRISIPRCLPYDIEAGSLQMHHFGDASSSGYSACSYLRSIDEQNNVNVSFLMGKSRVVPLKPVLSVPRLELVAAVLCVQIACKLKREMAIDCSHFYWSDSTVVLGYIRNEAARFKVFVANRIQQIHDGSRPDQWFHVKSSENPADDGSRGVWSERWLNGPSFLHDPHFQVPADDASVAPDDVELRCLSTLSNDEGPGFKVHVWRSWFSTVKLWAWVLRFIKNCQGQRTKGSLGLGEINHAKSLLVRQIQNTAFADELKDLKCQRKISRQSRLYKLDAFLDQDGIIRVGGRVRKSSLSLELKHPIVLPSDHDMSVSIIQYYHHQVHHQGRGITCAEIRNQGFWILGLQKVVKRLIHRCVTCSRLRRVPCEQKMADLPVDRLSPGPPFLFCGSDLFGPFVVKSGRREVKRHGAMFTCLVSRAVHIEVVHSLSSDSFVNAFRRFISLRGPVRELRCDQGTNFVGAKDDLLEMGCEMVFNPPSSSHRGGVWERMIGASRRVIEGILVEHGSRLDDEGLVTIMAETASVINSRPLSVENASDPLSLEPLTPNHLLTMKSKVIPKPLISPESVSVDLYARKQWKRVQYLIDLFWSRWRREIVQFYTSRSKWNSPKKNLKIDDVVLMVDEHCHRSSWKLARVLDVYPSDDGLVRSVRIKLSDGSCFHRPVQKLVHLLSSE